MYIKVTAAWFMSIGCDGLSSVYKFQSREHYPKGSCNVLTCSFVFVHV